jgi:hypothetical protein
MVFVVQIITEMMGNSCILIINNLCMDVIMGLNKEGIGKFFSFVAGTMKHWGITG